MLTADPLLFIGGLSTALGQEIASHARCHVGEALFAKFRDAESRVTLYTPVANRAVILVQSIISNDALMEALAAIDAARRHDAASVTLAAPFIAYGRQDKPTLGRQEPVTAALVLRMLQAAGANRILTLDMHNPSTAAAVTIPVHNLLPSPAFIPAWQAAGLPLDQLVVAATDIGGVRRATAIAEALGKGDPAVVAKRRTGDGACVSWGLIGDVAGRPVMLVDDLVSTGETLVQAAGMVLDHGASAVYASVTHVRGPVAGWLTSSPISRLFVTDSTPLPERAPAPAAEKLVVVSIARLLAQALTGGRTGQ